MLTDKEKLVLEEIKKNPLIRQEELSDKLSISRLAIATHISNLQKKRVHNRKRIFFKLSF